MSLARARSILSVDQWEDREAVMEVIKQTRGMVMDCALPTTKTPYKATGKILANLFYEPSTRTSSSFHAAMLKIGGHVIPINDVNYSSVSKGENLEDTIRTMGSYADVIVLRHPDVGAAQRAAKASYVPIINGGDGVGEHPSQAMLDLYTIYKEFDLRIDGLTVTMLGDLKHGRTVHSLSKLLRHFDVKINFVSPKSFAMPDEFVQPGDGVYTDLDEVIETTNVLYVTRVQWERIADGRPTSPDAVYKYRVTPEHMAKAPNKFRVLHPFPCVDEIDRSIDSDKRAAYFRQMRNGLYVRMALLESVF